MKPYTKTYMDFFGYTISDYIPCEIEGCYKPANDIHHIQCKGMGGSKLRDGINNIMAICREHHLEFGDKKQHKEMLVKTHLKFMKENSK